MREYFSGRSGYFEGRSESPQGENQSRGLEQGKAELWTHAHILH